MLPAGILYVQATIFHRLVKYLISVTGSIIITVVVRWAHKLIALGGNYAQAERKIKPVRVRVRAGRPYTYLIAGKMSLCQSQPNWVNPRAYGVGTVKFNEWMRFRHGPFGYNDKLARYINYS